ncbi:DUF7544 domain-containing protein [Haloferax denitrificans]|uniref:Glycerophosphoryl diester phosphodiesterase membrane domain-containing protein n=1 Tax=Haloferax denitrificans ATCC 35960 TaxID=662478 RepID=M0IU11_9EURY|nr:hypothetical protein [Haloferax denitrificans]EMA00337.1 hypothetical protein C438_17820 [Haloferax denitrificans ATCC 35960]
MSWKAIDALDDARDATASLLLPFDAGRWARLAFIALFIGGLGGSGGAGSNSGTTVSNGGGSTDIPVDSLPGFVTPENVIAAVIALVAVGLVLGLIWSFVGSVMQFVLVDAVVTKDVRIRKPFRERFWLGVRLFAFQIGLLIAIITVIGLPVAAVYFGSVAVTPGIALLAIPLVFLAIGLLFVSAIIVQLTTDFVVPTMIAEDRDLLSSWGRVVPVFRAELSEFGLYVIVRFILGILASIAVGIAALLATVVVAIPFAIVGGAAFLALNAANVALFSTVGLVVFGALGVLFVLAAIAVSAVVQMPVVTYFRYYSLFLLGSADDSLDLVSQFRSDDDSSAPEGPTPA